MSTLATQLGTFPSVTRRVGFDVEEFHGRGDGTLIELDEILGQADKFGFAVMRIWFSPKLYKNAVAAMTAGALDSHIFTVTASTKEQDQLKNSSCHWSYKPAKHAQPVDFFLDPDIRDNRVVLEGTCAT